MNEEDLKEEIKRLKEKIKKKDVRIKDLITKCGRLRYEANYYRPFQDQYLMLLRSFPLKYYSVQWSGFNKHFDVIQKRNFDELRKGICAAHVIMHIEDEYDQVQIIMIKEVAT